MQVGERRAPASYRAPVGGAIAGVKKTSPELAVLALEATIFDGEDIGAYRNFVRTHLWDLWRQRGFEDGRLCDMADRKFPVNFGDLRQAKQSMISWEKTLGGFTRAL